MGAISAQSRVTLCCHTGQSIASLVPMDRSQGCVCFQVRPGGFLRITANGTVDFNGGRNGPWTEIRLSSADGQGVRLQGVKSMRWLAVVAGEFVAVDEPTTLLPVLDNSGRHADGKLSEEGLLWLRLDAGQPCAFRVEKRGAHVLLMSDEGNLACGPQGRLRRNGAGDGQWARWEMEVLSGGTAFKNIGHSKYLARNADGVAHLVDKPDCFVLGSATNQAFAPATRALQELPPIDSGALSKEDVLHFRENGYVVLKGAVAPELVRDALRAINHQLGRPDCWVVDPNPLNAAQLSLKLPPHGVGGDVINKSPLFWSALNILLGHGNVAPWNKGQQVALRFPLDPSLGHDQADVAKRTRYHIDGMGQNKLCPFSLLCGVALSDQSQVNRGNLHVFPKSHLNKDLHRYYAERIDDDAQGESDEGKPDVGEPEQVLLEPGDVVIAHQLLAHRVGKNTSEHIRYQLYYRVEHKDHQHLRRSIVENPWVEYAI